MVNIVVGSLSPENCCGLQGLSGNSCNCAGGVKPKQIIAKKAGSIISQAVKGFNDVTYTCGSQQNAENSNKFLNAVENQIQNVNYKINKAERTLYYPLELSFTEM